MAGIRCEISVILCVDSIPFSEFLRKGIACITIITPGSIIANVLYHIQWSTKVRDSLPQRRLGLVFT